jgi:hypothetical protein
VPGSAVIFQTLPVISLFTVLRFIGSPLSEAQVCCARQARTTSAFP